MRAFMLWLIPGVLKCWWGYAWKGHSDNWALKNLSTGVDAGATGESLNSGDPAVHPAARHRVYVVLRGAVRNGSVWAVSYATTSRFTVLSSSEKLLSSLVFLCSKLEQRWPRTKLTPLHIPEGSVLTETCRGLFSLHRLLHRMCLHSDRLSIGYSLPQQLCCSVSLIVPRA